MKQRIFALALALVMVVGVFALVACQPTAGSDGIADLIAAGEKMTTEELIAKAKEETGQFIAYGNSSRITSAMEGFIAKYGAQIGLTADNAKASKQSDSEIYQLIAQEAGNANNSKGASMVLVQDGATLSTYLSATSFFDNFVPKTYAGVIGDADKTPLVHQYINKLFIWNNTGDNVPSFTNVWELTEAAYKNKIYFKSPNSEQVNMNFLIMLTSEEWSQKLADAYQAQYGKAITLDSDCPNAGYQFVKAFLNNCNFSINSDTTIAGELSKPENAGNMGLFVLSKFRDDAVIQENLQVAAWVDTKAAINPFAGFMYPLYCQMVTNGPRPYTAMLFIEYMMSEDGFAPWASLGSYSGNTTIKEVDGDSSLSFWKQNLVVENASYIASVKTDVSDFVKKLIG